MPTWETLEAFVRSEIQSTMQAVLEEELSAFLGRGKSERRVGIDPPAGYGKSTESWKTLFTDLKARGLGVPKLMLADGAAA